ncbi:site-specific DNA-methyltransferase [Helicobacter pylori]|uniref:site-specific DNA-methyltransferase n=1 Tax=Helicobacter pylori TaxID=210 RepID=UPI0002290746|nr:adenine-specific DNA methylase [Helicobacter pylori Puno135]
MDLVFNLKDTDTKTNTLNFSVTLSSKGNQTKISEILKECLNQGVELDEEMLKKALGKFKKQGSMDYFIHKNALGFLKEQLDLYLFEYLFKEMTAFDAKRLNGINIIKEVALEVVSLVSEFENELCKIWNKPRFVLNSHFIVSLDKLKAKNYDLNKITNHLNYPKQVKEWQDLNLKTTDNLLENEFLPLDTLYFKDLEEEIKNLFSEDEINGTLIKSENYQALNSLKNRYKETMDCIYIDPPYNTQNNEFIYADNFKRSSWLSMMANRLELAHKLLNDKGVMFVSIDDNEQAYLKALMDEVFKGGGGGDNFVNCLAVKRGTKSLNSQFNQIKSLNVAFEYILVYKKSNNFYYVNPYVKDANEKQKEGIWAGLYSNMDRPTMRYEIDGVNIAKGQWKWSKEKGLKALQNYKDFLNSNFDNLKKYYEHHKSLGNELDFVRKNNHNTIEYWVKPREKLIVDTNFMDLHTSGTSEIKELFEGQALFDTPKPEALLKRIIEISTQENDLVLDFFAGSGTTCAVAHKLKRKYIGIEMGEHFDSVILPRLKKVIGGFKSGAIKEFNGGGVVKVYALESYEEILRKIKYEDNDKPLAYDEQYSDLVGCKNESYTLNLNALEKMGVDIKETLENLWGLKVEFFNERVVKFKGNDKEVEILKALKEALIW